MQQQPPPALPQFFSSAAAAVPSFPAPQHQLLPHSLDMMYSSNSFEQLDDGFDGGDGALDDGTDASASASAKAKKRQKPYSKKACYCCRRAHAACDDQRPCSRCIKKNKVCCETEEEYRAEMAARGASVVARRGRPSGSRNKDRSASAAASSSSTAAAASAQASQSSVSRRRTAQQAGLQDHRSASVSAITAAANPAEFVDAYRQDGQDESFTESTASDDDDNEDADAGSSSSDTEYVGESSRAKKAAAAAAAAKRAAKRTKTQQPQPQSAPATTTMSQTLSSTAISPAAAAAREQVIQQQASQAANNLLFSSAAAAASQPSSSTSASQQMQRHPYQLTGQVGYQQLQAAQQPQPQQPPAIPLTATIAQLAPQLLQPQSTAPQHELISQLYTIASHHDKMLQTTLQQLQQQNQMLMQLLVWQQQQKQALPPATSAANAIADASQDIISSVWDSRSMRLISCSPSWQQRIFQGLTPQQLQGVNHVHLLDFCPEDIRAPCRDIISHAITSCSCHTFADCVWLLPQQAGNVAAVCKARLHCETADRGFFCFVCDGDINYVPADTWRSSVTIVELNNAEHKTVASKATPSPSHSDIASQIMIQSFGPSMTSVAGLPSAASAAPPANVMPTGKSPSASPWPVSAAPSQSSAIPPQSVHSQMGPLSMLLGISGGNSSNGLGNSGIGGVGVGSSAPTSFGGLNGVSLAASAGINGNGLLSMGSTPLPSPRPQSQLQGLQDTSFFYGSSGGGHQGNPPSLLHQLAHAQQMQQLQQPGLQLNGGGIPSSAVGSSGNSSSSIFGHGSLPFAASAAIGGLKQS